MFFERYTRYSLRDMFKHLKSSRGRRKEYYIEPGITFETNTEILFLLPTIEFQPWVYRYPGCAVVTIDWLHWHICFGTWRAK